jgi:hypothetical protein
LETTNNRRPIDVDKKGMKRDSQEIKRGGKDHK